MEFNPRALEAKRRHLDEILYAPERIERVVRSLLPEGSIACAPVARPWEPGGGASLFAVTNGVARYFLKVKHCAVTVESKLESEPAFASAPSLRNEHRMLTALADLEGVPRVIGYREERDMAFLLLERLVPFEEAVAGLDAPALVAAYARIADTVRALYDRGLVHTDVHEKNVLFRGEEPVLADFEEARPLVQAEPFEASLDVVGETASGNVGAIPAAESRLGGFTCLSRLRAVFASLVRARLEPLITACNFDSSCPYLATLDHGADDRIYQSIRVDGVQVAGQRPLDDPRIAMIARLAGRLFDRPFTHLDVGSNLGMFNLALAALAQVRRSIGVEAHPPYVALSRVLAFLAERPKAEFYRAVAGEDALAPLVAGGRVDLVTIYSVYHHIRDKSRFLDDLGQLAPAHVMLEMASQPECYDGGSWEAEIAAIGDALGMPYTTVLGASADYQRPIVLLSRAAMPADVVSTPPAAVAPSTASPMPAPPASSATPRVSVVLPVYNHGRFLPGAIESLCAQTFADFELIIVNDGSTDDTRAVLDAVTDPRISVIHQENRRLPTALNVGFARARGELFTWVSADNYCAPLFLEGLVGALDRYPEAAFAYSAFAWIDAADRIAGIHRDQAVSYRALLKQNPGLAAFLYRRSVCAAVGEYDPALEGAEDWDMWLRIAERAPAVYVPEILYYYRLHGDSMTAAVPDRVARASRQVVRNALARAGHRLDMHQLYPSMPECTDRAHAEYVACLDFGSMLLESPWAPVELAVPFLEAACELRAEPLAQLHLALANGRAGRWDEVRRLLPRLRTESPAALREAVEAMTVAVAGERSEAFLRLPVVSLRRDGIELFEREARAARVWSVTAAAAREAPVTAPAPTVALRGSAPSPAPIAHAVAPRSRSAPAMPPSASDVPADWRGPAPAAAPMVSVIVPTHDRPDTLRLALESILEQTYRDFEIVVVNDAGVDVREVLAEFASTGRISYVRHAVNRGLAAARNSGIGVARGKYLAYLDDDDRFYPEHLATLVRALERGDAPVVYSDALRIHQVREGNGYAVVARDLPYARDFDRDALLIANYFPVLTVMHARAYLDVVGRFDESLMAHEDWELWLRLSRRYQFTRLPTITAEFTNRVDGTSMTSSRQAEYLRTLDVIYHRYAGDVAGRADIEAARRAFREELRQRVDAAARGPAAATPAPVAARHAPTSGESQSDRATRTTTFDCSIIMPVFNGCELTEQCLTHLAAVTTGPTFEVIVVDNGSTDATGALLAKLGSDVQIIRNDENRGFAIACNQGARAARGRHLVFLNNDTIPLPGWLSPLVGELDSDGHVGVVGSKLLFPDGSIQHAGVVFDRERPIPYHPFRGLAASDPAANKRRELNCVTGACMAVRADLFTAVGGFDEGFCNGYEDVDFCLRVRQRGFKVVYQPTSVLYHLESQSPGRKDHDAANGRRLLARWHEAWWWIGDEDVVLVPEGWHRHTTPDGDRQGIARTDAKSRRQWERVAAVARALHADDRETMIRLLTDSPALPQDVSVLRWAATVAERLVHAEAPRVQS
jgi:GT2 family glycosyltransferase